MLLVVVVGCWLVVVGGGWLVVVGCCCWLVVGGGWLVGGARCKTFSTAPNMKRYAWTCSDHFGRRCFARIFFIVVLVCFVFQVFHVI